MQFTVDLSLLHTKKLIHFLSATYEIYHIQEQQFVKYNESIFQEVNNATLDLWRLITIHFSVSKFRVLLFSLN